MAVVYPGTDGHVAHLAGSKAAVRELRDEVAARARADLEARRVTGDHQILVAMQDTDGLVILEGRSPLSVEYGRGEYTRVGADGQLVYVGPMDGLHILGRAAGL